MAKVELEKQEIEVEWAVYAEYYDEMCSKNPAYDSMLTDVVNRAKQAHLPEKPKVLDIGAGTGNLIQRLSEVLPDASFTHLDIDKGMNRRAAEKYQLSGLKRVEIVECAFLDWVEPDHKFDLVLSTNALYTINPYRETLAKIHGLSADPASLILVDFGRKQNTNDWVWYIAKNSLRTNGIKETVRFLRENWEAARQNKKTTAAQSSGKYWLHDTSQFSQELTAAGFDVSHVEECYRGYSDIAVCKKRLGEG